MGPFFLLPLLVLAALALLGLWARERRRCAATVADLGRSRAATARLEQALRLAGAGAFELDLEGRRLQVDPPDGPCIPAEEWEAHIHPEDLDRARAVLAARRSEPAPLDLTVRVRAKAGSWSWIRYLAEPVPDQPRLAGSFQDQSECHAADALLRAELQEWKTMFEALDEPVWLLDAARRVRRCNDAAAALAGGGAPLELGPCSCAVVAGQPSQSLHCRFGQVLASQRPETWEAEEDGRIRRATLVPLLDADGAVQGMVCRFSDITEQRRTEARLRESDRILAAIMDNFAGPIAVLDRDLRYQRFNAIHARNMDQRYGRRIAVGMAMAEAVAGLADWDPLEGRLRAALAGSASDFELAVRVQDGGTRLYRSRYLPLKVEGGPAEGVVILAEDITELRSEQAAHQARLEDALLWQEVMLDREDRIQSLKAEVNDLLDAAGQPPRYRPASEDDHG